jgi:AcrR family transcriptional regulator
VCPDAQVNAPLQDRSRRTLDKIVRAVEQLLEVRPFEQMSVADIIRRARCSTGSFYARFPTKDAVLPYLYARYDADLRPRMAAKLASVDWSSLSLRETVELFVSGMVDMYLERRNLLRAVALFVRANPDAIGDDIRQRREAVHDMPARLLGRFAAEIAHDDAMEAARVGFFIVAAAARDKLLFDAPHGSATRLTNAQLKTQLSRTLYAYLTCR